MSKNKVFILITVIVVILIYGFLLLLESIETEAIHTPRGVINFLTFRCYNGAGGNSWCDPDDPCHSMFKEESSRECITVNYDGKPIIGGRPILLWEQILRK